MLVTNCLSKQMKSVLALMEARFMDKGLSLFPIDGMTAGPWADSVSAVAYNYYLLFDERVSLATVRIATDWYNQHAPNLRKVVAFFRWSGATLDAAHSMFSALMGDRRWWFNQRSDLIGLLTVGKEFASWLQRGKLTAPLKKTHINRVAQLEGYRLDRTHIAAWAKLTSV